MPEPMGTNPQGSPTMETAAQEAAKFLASQPPADQGASPDAKQAPPSQQPQPDQGQAELFEIVHEGQKRQLPKEEVVKLAQMGFDYTQKMQRLALLRNMPPEQIEQLSRQAAALKQLQDFAAQNPDFVEYLNSYRPGWKGAAGNQGQVPQGQSPQTPSPDLAQLQQRLWQIEAQNVERQLEEAIRTLPQKIADRLKRKGVEIPAEEIAKQIRTEDILETAYKYKLPLEEIDAAFFLKYGDEIAARAVQGYLKAKTAQAGPKVPGPGGTPAVKTQEPKTFDQAAKAALAYLRAAEEQSNY